MFPQRVRPPEGGGIDRERTVAYAGGVGEETSEAPAHEEVDIELRYDGDTLYVNGLNSGRGVTETTMMVCVTPRAGGTLSKVPPMSSQGEEEASSC